MGSQTDKCGTCGNYHKNCIGHFGHIPLPFPVFQPLLSQQYMTLLETLCVNCLKCPVDFKKGDLATQLKDIKSQKTKQCPHCKNNLQHLIIEYLGRGKTKTKIPLHIKCTKFQAYNIKKIITGQNQMAKGGEDIVILSPHYVNSILKNLMVQKEAKQIVQNIKSFDCFMIQSIPVPPNSLRVSTQQQKTQSHAMNGVYGAIISSKQYLQSQQLFEDGLFLINLEKQHQTAYNRIIVGSRIALYKDTSRTSKPQVKQLLLDVLGLVSQEPASCLSQALTKKGWNRQYVSSSRVGMSGRTVVVGDPLLAADECVIPEYFAENLFLPNNVNNMNVQKLKSLINNFPKYPCAVRRVSNGITYTISEENKQIQALQCNLGDVVMVQLITGDIAIIHRYPTIREESATAMRIKVEKTKALKLPLSIIAKKQADFDGDEMQTFVLSSKEDCMEAVCCMSVCSQFITYQSGLNVIGGNVAVQNITPAMFHLQHETFLNKYFPDITGKNDSEKLNGVELIQKLFENKIYVSDFDKKRFSQLNYDDGKIIVKNGKFQKIDLGLVSENSQFLTYIQFHHGQYKAIEVLNNITHLSYRVNHIFASTVLNNMFLEKTQRQYLRNITLDRVRTLQSLINDFYEGKIAAPAGFDLEMYFEDIYVKRLVDDEMVQQQKLLEYIQIPKTNFLNKYYNTETLKVLQACSHVGQQYDNQARISIDKYYGRTIISQPRFQPSPQSGGYILGNFYEGLTQKEMYMNAQSERRGHFVKGNTTAVGGYLARRLNQGAGNVFARPNGILTSDGDQVISFQYGACGYNSRNYVVIKFDKHRIPIEEFDAQYKQHPRYEEMLEIRNNILEYESILKQTIPSYRGSDELVVPFKFYFDTISEEELDNILSCRLCEKMSEGFQEIVLSQAYTFYIYALFFLKIDPDSKNKVVDKYLSSLVQIGDPVGMKAALSCSQPYTQSMLSAIHSKGGAMVVVQEDRTSGFIRFQELIIGNKGPIVVQFQLLGKQKYDFEKNIKFITEHQTIKFTDLKPQILILQSHDPYIGEKDKIKNAFKNQTFLENSHFSSYIMKISFQIKQLAYYTINIQMMIDYLMEDNPVHIKMIVPYQDGEKMCLVVYCDVNITKQQLSMIKNQLLTKQLLGSKLLYNLYLDPPTELKPGQSYTIRGNLTNKEYKTQKDALLNLYSTPRIDPASIYCSDPKQFIKQCGIVKARLQQYTELNNNLATSSATKQVQSTHVRLLTDLLTQTGELSSFTRNSYRKDGIRDIYSLFLFEEGNVFLSAEVQNPHLQLLNTSLNSCIFGTRAELGSSVSQIMFNNILKKQNHAKLDKEME